MHDTAMANGKRFFQTYVSNLGPVKVVEIGSQNVNGSLRDVSPADSNYIGLDFQAGNGVDIVIDDPYTLPFDEDTVDVVVSSSCFEHAEMFWLVFIEALRVLKPQGLLYINVPSNGAFHQYPVDCWRFYPDAAKALVTWANRTGLAPAILESYVAIQGPNRWSDFVAVFVKDESHAGKYPLRITDNFKEFENCSLYGNENIINPKTETEDMRKITRLQEENARLSDDLNSIHAEIVRASENIRRYTEKLPKGR